MDRRSSEPRVLVAGSGRPAGSPSYPTARLLVGYGDSAATASRSDRDPQAGLLRVDPRTGSNRRTRRADDGQRRRPRARRRRLRLERLRDRRRPRARGGSSSAGRRCRHRTASSSTPAGGTLYAAQTFVPRRSHGSTSPIRRTSRPGSRRRPADYSAGLDGLTRDAHDRLYAAANIGGAVWRIGDDRHALRPRAPAAARAERGRLRHRARQGAPRRLRPSQPLRDDLPG